MQAAEEREHDKNYQYQPQHAAKTGTTVAGIAVVTAATEQQQKYDDNQQIYLSCLSNFRQRPNSLVTYFPLSASLRPPTAF